MRFTPLVVTLAVSTCADAVAISRGQADADTRQSRRGVAVAHAESSINQATAARDIAIGAPPSLPLVKLNRIARRDGDDDDDDDDDEGDSDSDSDDDDDDDDGPRNKPGIIAGSVVGGLAALALLGGAWFWFRIRPRRLRRAFNDVRSKNINQTPPPTEGGAAGGAQPTTAQLKPSQDQHNEVITVTGVGAGFVPPPDYNDSQASTYPSSSPSSPDNYGGTSSPSTQPSALEPTAPTAELLSSAAPNYHTHPQLDEHHVDPNPEIPLGPQTLTEHPADQPNPRY